MEEYTRVLVLGCRGPPEGLVLLLFSLEKGILKKDTPSPLFHSCRWGVGAAFRQEIGSPSEPAALGSQRDRRRLKGQKDGRFLELRCCRWVCACVCVRVCFEGTLFRVGSAQPWAAFYGERSHTLRIF